MTVNVSKYGTDVLLIHMEESLLSVAVNVCWKLHNLYLPFSPYLWVKRYEALFLFKT